MELKLELNCIFSLPFTTNRHKEELTFIWRSSRFLWWECPLKKSYLELFMFMKRLTFSTRSLGNRGSKHISVENDLLISSNQNTLIKSHPNVLLSSTKALIYKVENGTMRDEHKIHVRRGKIKNRILSRLNSGVGPSPRWQSALRQ